MKIFFLIFFLVSFVSHGASTLAPDWVQEGVATDSSVEVAQSFGAILDAQAQALDRVEEKASTQKALPFGFHFNEMVTDVAVSRSGLLGISALNSSAGVELKWKRVKAAKLIEESEEEGGDFLIEEELADKELETLVDSVVEVVKASGKVRMDGVRPKVKEAIESANAHARSISVTTYERWRAQALRLDLNFGVSGSLWFIAKAGVALRVRMEWKLKERPLSLDEHAGLTDQGKFVMKVLGELNESLEKVSLKGYELKKIMVGVGASQKKRFFGLWKYNAGFLGWIGFVPVKASFEKGSSMKIPSEILGEDFIMGDGEETSEKGAWPWRRRRIPRVTFQKGLTKSLQTAAFFAEESLKHMDHHWRLSEIKTVNQISHTGFFGLSDVTAQGNLEIDFKRRQQ